ncbi:MAG: hypothetical protein K5634_07630 [Sphaerochaetaceae bacterium]|nr:hypothetical protein [Sphaerochaetaceae bacterium]
MSENTISTVDELKDYLKKNLSEHRYIHTLGVAQTTEKVLRHYGCTDYVKTWNNFSAGEFCGLVHDLAREKRDQEILDYCKTNSLELKPEEVLSPVLAHGLVSAHMAARLCGEYPLSWYRAICLHTTGDREMDDLALSLFVADFIEPSRKFLTDDDRKRYLSSSSLTECTYAILCDMIEHWKRKGYHDASGSSLSLKADLEERIRRGN